VLLYTHTHTHKHWRHAEVKYYLGGATISHCAISLLASRDLISSNYTETHYTANGTMVTVAMQDQCYYHGWVGDNQESIASISTCKGIRGFFRTENHDYVIEPLSDSQTGEHVIYRAELLKARDVHCGVTKTMDSALPKFTRRGHPQHRVSGASAPCWKLVILVDADVKDVDMNKVRMRMFEIINFVNRIYLPLNTFIALVGLEVWSDRDKISVGPPAEQTLSAFTDWRNNELNKIKQSDHAQLISVVHFGGLVGLAYIGSLCSTDSTILVRVMVLAHELGHNLGMSHDSPTCFCTKHHCIMGATLSAPPPQHFSSCSVAEFEEFLRSAASLQCLSNNPNNTTITPPVCGNGFLEEGEDCDCIVTGCCLTLCVCLGRVCVTGFLPLVVMCRPVRSECDLPEYCTGMSSECPEDTFRANGAPCSNNTGYCHGGQCPRRLDQCTGTWGQTAQTASDSCYELNTHGTQYAYCTRPSPDVYTGCQPKDVACGKLFCWNGSAEPRHGTAVMIGSCKATVHGDPSADYGQVHTGTKCGEGLVCSNSACVELGTVYEEPNCTKCPEHAVCNNKGACQCAAGWAPPDCASPHTDYIATAAGESCYLTDGCTCVSECHTLPKKL
uniref:ADAM metallopeptidase domain 28 n=1 Tax=Electrophorus electricus TaxID=8005 RepID=A0A4W4EWN8_ELEEL